jgi:hypothetical protein
LGSRRSGREAIAEAVLLSKPLQVLAKTRPREPVSCDRVAAAHFQRGDHARLVAGLTRRLHHLGYAVTLRPAA